MPVVEPFSRPPSQHRYDVEPNEVDQERAATAPIHVTRIEQPSDAPADVSGQHQTQDDGTRIVPSVTEVAVYTFLGAGIASAVFILGERPYWHVALVALAALVIVLVSALVSRRDPTRASPDPRPGRRRRS